MQTDARLPWLNFTMHGTDQQITLDGATVRVATDVHSREELEIVLETYYYALPPLLGLEMLDSPIVAEVRGRLGGVSFCWGLVETGIESIDVTTKERQEERVRRAFSRLGIVDKRLGLANRRLLAATHYFQIACRLLGAQGRRGEFLSESILNFAKVLEVLFPAAPQQSIDTTRQALTGLDFTEVEIEALYIPAVALRNSIDVAHPTLAVFTNDQLKTLARYSELAEGAFRVLLDRIFDSIGLGKFELKALPDTKPSPETLRVITRVDENLKRYETTRVSLV
ncbi:MAG: hypothetical protein EXR70_01000 [Deltaproteobacteria bacterium]|nr:hypothetical protein [Deltaproteobacteria bacterium]